MRMQELHRQTFRPADLKFSQLELLTPKDPVFRQAEFLVLNEPWEYQKGNKRVVIVCAQSRIEEGGKRVYAVSYSTGETAWVEEAVIGNLLSGEYSVLPQVR